MIIVQFLGITLLCLSLVFCIGAVIIGSVLGIRAAIEFWKDAYCDDE